MPDEPTPNSDPEAPSSRGARPTDPPTGEPVRDRGQVGEPPTDDAPSRWYGPSGQSDPPPPAPPYGAPPYGAPLDSPPSYGAGPPPYGAPGTPPYGSGYVPPYGAGYAPYTTAHQRYGPPQDPYAPPRQSPPYAWPYMPMPPRRAPRSEEERRRRNRRALVTVVLVLLAVGAGIGIGAAIAPTSPQTTASALVDRAITAAARAGTYHYVERFTALGVPDDVTGDAAPDGGRQVIRQRCSGGTNHFDLRLVGGVVYFNGTLLAAVDQLGVPRSRAASVAGRWVKVVKGEKPYASFADGITARSNASQLRTAIIPTSSKTVLGSSPASTRVLGALAETPTTKDLLGTAALLLTTSTGLPRTLRGVEADTRGRVTLDLRFTNYHEAVRVAAPSRTLSYSSLHATPPTHACS